VLVAGATAPVKLSLSSSRQLTGSIPTASTCKHTFFFKVTGLSLPLGQPGQQSKTDFVKVCVDKCKAEDDDEEEEDPVDGGITEGVVAVDGAVMVVEVMVTKCQCGLV
jgi:hypothetical protein